MPIIDDPKYQEAQIVGPVRQDLMTVAPRDDLPHPAMLDTLAAAARQSNIAGAAYERLFGNPDPDVPDVPNFEPLDHIAGYEDHANSFLSAASPSDVAGIKARIDDERADRETLARAGFGGHVASAAFGLVDPSFLVSASLPELSLARAGRLYSATRAAFSGAVGAGVYEAGMQALQQDRSGVESAINIGAGALLSGVLGSLARRVPKADLDAAHARIDAEAPAPVLFDRDGGAMAVHQTTLADETAVGGGQALSRLKLAPGNLATTDLQILMNADVPAARLYAQELADVPAILAKNTEGIATPTSVESLVGRHEGQVAAFADKLDELYATYRKRLGEAQSSDWADVVGKPMARQDFRAAVSAAARRGDRSVEPEVEAAAQYMRQRIFDPLKERAQALDLLPKEVNALGAASYVRRMYSREAIRADREGWDRALVTHFSREIEGEPRVSMGEAQAAAADVTRRILGMDHGDANYGVRVDVPNAGPLNQRVLDIPDEQIEKFLENDPIRVAGAYVKDLAPQIEITARFGDKTMADALDKIHDQYDLLRAEATKGLAGEEASRVATHLSDREQQAVEALKRVRDRIYGRAGRLSGEAGEGARKAVEFARGWRNWVAASRLGAAAITSAPTDLARIVAQYGFTPTMGKLARLVTSPTFRRLSREQARDLGAAVDVAMSRRVVVAFDGGPQTEGWTALLAHGLYKWSGLSHWTDFARTLSVTLLENEVLKTAAQVAAGEKIPAFRAARLASLGLDQDALRQIHAEVLAHGGEVNGVRVSGSASWANGPLAARYDAALLKEARQTVFQPSAANHVWWADSETGKVLGQLKSFSLGAVQGIAMPVVQALGSGQYGYAARFIGSMMVGGYLAHALRQLAAGKQPNTDPVGAAGEALSESGIAGVLPDLIAPVGRRLGFGESARFSNSNVLSLFGPAVGSFGDAYDLAMNRTADGVSAKDLTLMRRLLPFQNLWWARRAINALEGEAAEAMNLKGATHETVLERVTKTDPLTPAGQRGGTGTGMIAP